MLNSGRTIDRFYLFKTQVKRKEEFILTHTHPGDIIKTVKIKYDFLLFRVVEIQRIYEATATPTDKGRCQPERTIEQ